MVESEVKTGTQVYQLVSDQFICGVCRFSSTDVNSYLAHKSHHSIHLEKEVFQCELCNNVFDNTESLQGHYYNFHKIALWFAKPNIIETKQPAGNETYLSSQIAETTELYALNTNEIVTLYGNAQADVAQNFPQSIADLNMVNIELIAAADDALVPSQNNTGDKHLQYVEVQIVEGSNDKQIAEQPGLSLQPEIKSEIKLNTGNHEEDYEQSSSNNISHEEMLPSVNPPVIVVTKYAKDSLKLPEESSTSVLGHYLVCPYCQQVVDKYLDHFLATHGDVSIANDFTTFDVHKIVKNSGCLSKSAKHNYVKRIMTFAESEQFLRQNLTSGKEDNERILELNSNAQSEDRYNCTHIEVISSASDINKTNSIPATTGNSSETSATDSILAAFSSASQSFKEAINRNQQQQLISASNEGSKEVATHSSDHPKTIISDDSPLNFSFLFVTESSANLENIFLRTKFICLYCSKCMTAREPFIKHMLTLHKDSIEGRDDGTYDKTTLDNTHQTVNEYSEEFLDAVFKKSGVTNQKSENVKYTKAVMTLCDYDKLFPIVKPVISPKQQEDDDDSNAEKWTGMNSKNGNKNVKVKKYSNVRRLEKQDVEGLFPCPVCGKVFARLRYLRRHVRIHKEESEEKSDSKKHSCPDCGKEYTRVESLKNHRKVQHLRDVKFRCDTCGFTSNDKKEIFNHRQTHPKGSIQCHICGLVYPDRSTLGRHLHVHDQSRPHLCKWEGCTWRFKSKMMMNAHYETHLNTQGKFVCQYCGKSFRRKHHLQRHQISAHGTVFPKKRSDFGYQHLSDMVEIPSDQLEINEAIYIDQPIFVSLENPEQVVYDTTSNTNLADTN